MMEDLTFELLYELEDIESVEEVGYKNCYDISVEGNHTFLLSNGLVSHNSAFSGLSKILGRNGIGYFQLKGKPLNAWTCSHQKFMANEELSGLYQVIKNENFKHVVVASDADLDGFHIRGLISTFMYKFLPDEIDKLGFLNTPVVVYSKGEKITGWTYSLYDKKELQRGEVSDYKKGLGSWNEDELEEVIKKDGLDKMIEHIEFDDDSKTAIDEWFGNDSEPRKKYIIENDFSIASA